MSVPELCECGHAPKDVEHYCVPGAPSRKEAREDNSYWEGHAAARNNIQPRLDHLREVMIRCANKLEEFGNEEPKEVVRVLREAVREQ